MSETGTSLDRAGRRLAAVAASSPHRRIIGVFTRPRAAGDTSLSARDWLGILAAALIVGAPALFTKDGFEIDFTNHLWLVSVQAHAIARGGVPTYFLSATYPTAPLNQSGPFAFYPFFAFYGGTLYALTGALAVALGGQVIAAYVLSIMLAIAAAYGGTLWLARQLGVRTWRAHAPAITFASSAYYVTNLYGRGAWPEFVAVSMIPLLGASAWRIARAERVPPLAAAVFVAASVIFTGSHNITLVWGSVVIVAAVAALLIAFGRRAAPVSWRRLGWLVGLGALAVGANAWFLVIDLQHAAGTEAASTTVPWYYTGFFDTVGVLFDPLRTVPAQSTTPALFVQLPVWFLAWALVGAAGTRRRWDRDVVRGYLAVMVVLVVLLVLLLSEGAYDLLPHVLLQIQFPYRLVSYATLAVAGLVLVTVIALERPRPRTPGGRRLDGLGLSLAMVTVASVALCVWQLWVPATHTPTSYDNRSQAIASVHVYPRTWYSATDYADMSAKLVVVAAGRSLTIDPTALEGNGATLTVTPPIGGAPFATNILAGPYMVTLHGLTDVGRTVGGEMVAARPNNGAGPVRLSITLTQGGDITIGRAISVACGLALLALLALAGIARLRRRRVGRPRRQAAEHTG